jgi:hypothetical protein
VGLTVSFVQLFHPKPKAPSKNFTKNKAKNQGVGGAELNRAKNQGVGAGVGLLQQLSHSSQPRGL